MTRDISNSDDMIDSRDVIERIEELEGEQTAHLDSVGAMFEPFNEDTAGDIIGGGTEPSEARLCVTALPEPAREEVLEAIEEWEDWDNTEGYELDALRELATEAEGSPDWTYGETLIRYDYFKDYARDLADDCGLLMSDNNSQWPARCIDWDQAARELQADYFSVDYDGIEYFIRS